MAGEETFNFAEAYRMLQPAAERSVFEARAAALAKISTQGRGSVAKIVAIARITFGVPLPSDDESAEWLQAIVRERDASFSLAMDREEARIICAVVLQSVLQAGFDRVATLILAAGFANLRTAPCKADLERVARDIFLASSRRRGVEFKSQLATGQWRDTSKATAAMVATFDGATTRNAIEAIAAEAKASQSRLVERFNSTLEALRTENIRLAEEVDLLWWHLGGWSYILERPLSSVDAAALPYIIGSDVAEMVNEIPGPHGALAIIAKALGTSAEAKQTIEMTLRAVNPDDRAKLLTRTREANAVAALNYGLAMLDDEAVAGSFTMTFERRTAIAPNAEVTRYQIAAQAYFERMFVKGRWF